MNFTSKMELSLDEISGGQRNWKKTLDEFYQTFSRRLQEARQNMAEATPEQKYKVIKPCPACEGGQLGEPGDPKVCFTGVPTTPTVGTLRTRKRVLRYHPNRLDKFCPECGEQLVVREGKTVSSSAAVASRTVGTRNRTSRKGEEEKYCPDCGSRMRKIKGKTGEFWGCTGTRSAQGHCPPTRTS